MSNKKKKKSFGYVEVKQFELIYLLFAIIAAAATFMFTKFFLLFEYLTIEIHMLYTVSTLLLAECSAAACLVFIIVFLFDKKKIKLQLKGVSK